MTSTTDHTPLAAGLAAGALIVATAVSGAIVATEPSDAASTPGSRDRLTALAADAKCEPTGGRATKTCATLRFDRTGPNGVRVNFYQLCAQTPSAFAQPYAYVETDLRLQRLDNGQVIWSRDAVRINNDGTEACRSWGIDKNVGAQVRMVAYYDAKMADGTTESDFITVDTER